MSYVVPSRRAVTGLELLAILALPVVASLVAILISTIAMMLIFDDLKTIEVYVIPAALAGYGITLFTTLRVQRWSLSDLGFHPIKRTWAYLLWQVPGIITVCGMISLAATVLVTHPETSDSQEMADTFKFGPVAVVLSILAISIIGPIIEEICFRRFIMGYLDQKLLPRMQARTAIICSTLASSLFNTSVIAVLCPGTRRAYHHDLHILPGNRRSRTHSMAPITVGRRGHTHCQQHDGMFGRAIHLPQWHVELTRVETCTDHRCNIPTLWQKGTPLFLLCLLHHHSRPLLHHSPRNDGPSCPMLYPRAER